MAYIQPNYQFTDIPMPFESMTMDQAREASAAVLAGEISADAFIGDSVAGAERYGTPIFSTCYVSRGYVAFRDYTYIGRNNRYAECDAQIKEIGR